MTEESTAKRIYREWVREQGWHQRLTRCRAALGKVGNYILAVESGQPSFVEDPIEAIRREMRDRVGPMADIVRLDHAWLGR